MPATFVGALAAALPFVPQDAVQLRVEHLRESVHVLFGRGGNIALCAGPDGVLMVDSQFAPLAEGIAAEAAGLSERGVTYVTNTHHHGDHTGGNGPFVEGFGGLRGASVIAHENVRARMESSGGQGLPAVTYGEAGCTLHVNGERIVLRHYPNAHTDGDTVVWFEQARICHMGDVFFQSQYPFSDKSAGGDYRGILDAVGSVLEWLPDDALVIPGHGEVTDKGGLSEYFEMLQSVVAQVGEALGAGKSTEEILAMGILEPFNPRWGGGSFMTPERFLPMVVDHLRD